MLSLVRKGNKYFLFGFSPSTISQAQPLPNCDTTAPASSFLQVTLPNDASIFLVALQLVVGFFFFGFLFHFFKRV